MQFYGIGTALNLIPTPQDCKLLEWRIKVKLTCYFRIYNTTTLLVTLCVHLPLLHPAK